MYPDTSAAVVGRSLATAFALFTFLAPLRADAKNIYVWPGSPSPLSPYGSWNTAARSIQPALDAAVPGDTVWVTNGVYSTGSRSGLPSGSTLMTRVCVPSGVMLRSTSGPSVTVIAGAGPLGPSAVRCVYAGTNASVTGFTLTSGFTGNSGDAVKSQSGGGAWCEPGAALSNCVLSANRAAVHGGAACGGSLVSCQVVSNAAASGGAACRSVLIDCSVAMNRSGADGGGLLQSAAYGCDIYGNAVTNWGNGGGASSSALYRCSVRLNTAMSAGGVWCGSASNCWVTCNSATHGNGGGMVLADAFESVIASNACVLSGGGVYEGTLRNCLVFANEASMNSGGGACDTDTLNCTIVRNHAGGSGGGVYGGVHESGIIYSNAAASGDNYWDSDLRWCCTAPDFGVQDCFDGDPLFFNAAANDFRLKYGSPCIDRRTAGVLTPWDQVMTARPLDGDFDGQASYDVGALEYNPLAYDSDADAMPDLWEHLYRLNPVNPADAFMDADGDGHEAWQEYVSGSVPTNRDSALRALIDVGSGWPRISWTPDLGTARVYTVEVKAWLTDAAWGPTNAGSRLFRVGARMP